MKVFAFIGSILSSTERLVTKSLLVIEDVVDTCQCVTDTVLQEQRIESTIALATLRDTHPDLFPNTTKPATKKPTKAKA